ncbi:MAG: MBL fold metallo-hydrolase [Halobacteriales archaeon]
MVHATWDDWFVREEVEGVDPEGMSVWYLGCNGFIIRTPATTVYIDPYFGDGDPPGTTRMIPVPMDAADATRCDGVLITHEHIDHTHPPSYGPLVEDLGATIIAPSAAYERPDYDGGLRAPAANRETVAPGTSVTIGDLAIHVREANDPDAIEPVSYVIEHDAGTLFHGGDTRPAESFAALGREFDIDIGILAVGSVGRIYDETKDEGITTRWYMDENEVVEAANELQFDRLVPSHYDMWKGVGADPKAIHDHARSYPCPQVIEPMQIGDRINVAEPGIVPLTQL